jgi:glycosyltransferase involved in cell wall biosynthesis
MFVGIMKFIDSASRDGTNFGFAGPKDRQLRLLFATTVAESVGFLAGQLTAAKSAGFEVIVVSSPGEIATRITDLEGVRHIALEIARDINIYRDLVSLVKLIRLMSRLKPDLINAGTPKAGLLFMIAGRVTRVPCSIYTLHGLRGEAGRGFRYAIVNAATRLTCLLAHRVICVSHSLQERAIEMRILKSTKSVVLRSGSANGVDVSRFTSTPQLRDRARGIRQSLNIPADACVIGFAGRIARDKGISDLAESWKIVRQEFTTLHLIMLGSPDPTDPIPASVNRQLDEDDRVHWIPFTSDPVPVYLLMDIVVLPTYREGFPNVPIEAAALERPVVGTRVTGCVDSVEDGVTGTLVSPHDPIALAAAISRYVKDPILRTSHGTAGRRRVIDLFQQKDLWAAYNHEYLCLARRANLFGSEYS